LNLGKLQQGCEEYMLSSTWFSQKDADTPKDVVSSRYSKFNFAERFGFATGLKYIFLQATPDDDDVESIHVSSLTLPISIQAIRLTT